MTVKGLDDIKTAATAVLNDILAPKSTKDLAQTVIDLIDTIAYREPTRNVNAPLSDVTPTESPVNK